MRIRWRGLELPSRVQPTASTLTDTYGKFHAEPFERGFGMTVGNSLRRILLSSLEGSAVTRVKIQGVQHEISHHPRRGRGRHRHHPEHQEPGGQEHSATSRRPSASNATRRGVGPRRPTSITTRRSQIINPDHIIATLTDDVPFVVEMTVENGRGYRTAEENAGKEREIGVIPVDRSFSPVVRVKYDIEETRVGQRTNYDKLVMEIWTNGTVGAADGAGRGGEDPPQAPEPVHPVHRARAGDAARRADRDRPARRRRGVDAELERKLNMSLAELELSVRATNCLESEGITTVRDLVIRTEDELLEVRNFGETTLSEVKSKLEERGLTSGCGSRRAARSSVRQRVSETSGQ